MTQVNQKRRGFLLLMQRIGETMTHCFRQTIEQRKLPIFLRILLLLVIPKNVSCQKTDQQNTHTPTTYLHLTQLSLETASSVPPIDKELATLTKDAFHCI